MTDTTKLRRVAVNLDRKGKPESAKLVAQAAQEIDALRAEVERLKPKPEGGDLGDFFDRLRRRER